MRGGLKRTDFFTVSTLRVFGGLEKTDFKQFLIWDGVVVLKKLILIVLHLGGSGGLERTHFKQCLLWEGVVVLKN